RTLRRAIGAYRQRFGPARHRAARGAASFRRRVAAHHDGKARSGQPAASLSEERVAARRAKAGLPDVGPGHRIARDQDSRICAEADPRAPLAASHLLPPAAAAYLGAVEPARQAGRFLRDEREADGEDRDARSGHGEEERPDECQDNPGGDESATLPRAGGFAVHPAVALLKPPAWLWMISTMTGHGARPGPS